MANPEENIFQENSEGFFLRVVESIPMGILLFNSEGRITYLNNSFLEFCVYHKIEINPSNKINLFAENIFPDYPLLASFQKLREGYSFEKEIGGEKSFHLRKIIILLKAIPLFKDDKFDGGILLLQDIKIGKHENDQPKNIDNQWKEILSSSIDLLLLIDNDGEIKFSIGRKLNRLSWRISPFEKLTIQNLFPIEIQKLLNSQIQIVKDILRANNFYLQLYFNKKPFDYECEIEPILDEDKETKLLLLKFTDISKFLRNQKALEIKIQEMSIQQNYLDNISVPIFVIDANGRVVYWNKGSQELFGYSEFQAAGKYFVRLIGITEPNFFEGIKKQLAQSKQIQSNFNIISLNGNEEIINAKFDLIKEIEPYVVISCQSITEKIALEKKLEEAEKKLTYIVHNSENIIFKISLDGRFIFANQSFTKIFDLKEPELLQKNFNDFIEPNFRTRHSLADLLSLSDKQQKLEIPLLTSEKRIIFLSGVLKRTIDELNDECYYGYFYDITSTKQISNEFKILSSIIKSTQDGIAVELNNKIILANESFASIFGCARSEDLLGRSFVEMVADEDVKRISEYLHLLRRKMDAPNRFEFLGKREDGTNTFYSATVSEFDLDGKVHLVYLIRDITERKRSQQALRESEEKYRSLIENIDDFFYTYEIIKGKLRPVFYSESVKKITGYTQTELVTDSKLFLKIIHPDDIHLVKDKIKELLKSRIRNSTEIEFRIFNRYGNIVWVRHKINLIRDDNGNVKKLYGITGDVSGRKKVEEDLKKSSAELVRLNSAKDKFLSIVSHDLRTPFSSILGFTDLLLNDENLSAKERKDYVKFIQESSASMLELVNSLLNWNRLQSGRIDFEPEKINIGSVIDSSINTMIGAAIKKNIKIVSNVPQEIQVFVDKNLIKQVFNNLISNALKFTSLGGTISISVKPAQQLRFFEFAVQDTGIGIKPEDLKKLFSIETKFTKDGTSGEKGSGLGLTIVSDIIQKHGGTIWVESEPQKGSTFKFTLPVASAIILLVDDNKTDRLLYSKILKNITPDYTVEAASNGKEALQKIKKSAPALVITDHNMPEMNGIKLVQEVQKLDTKLIPPIIVLSGDIDRIAIHDYGLLGVDYIFQKPVNLSNFKQAVERTIRKGLLGE